MKPRRDPTITTARLTLRRRRTADADDLVAAIGDLRVSRMLARVPCPYRRERRRGVFVDAVHRARRAATASEPRHCPRGRLHRGGIGVNDLPDPYEIGYWLARRRLGSRLRHRGRSGLLAYGFEVLGLRLIRSAVFTENRASLRVQQKLGFAIIGRVDASFACARRTRSRISTRY